MAGRRSARARRVVSAAVTLLAIAVALSDVSAVAADRTFRWSGYQWTVRRDVHRSDPGNNRWGDSRRHARVQSDGTLRVDIVRGRSVEVVGPHTTYGRYRWVVQSDLSGVHPFRVAAFFVRGTRGEQDIEFSRWGEPLRTEVGTWVTWRDSRRLAYGFFALSPVPPYTIQIDWRPGAARFQVHDAVGTPVLDTSYPARGGGRHMAPRVSYWMYPGHGSFRSPFTSRSAHPPVIVRSFRFTPLRRKTAEPRP